MTSVRSGCTTAIGSGRNGSRSRRGSKAPRFARARSAAHQTKPEDCRVRRLSVELRVRPGRARVVPPRGRSLGDDAALRNVLVKIVVEIVVACAERGQAHGYRFAGLDGFFAIEPEALEFDRLVARVHDFDRYDL